MSCETNRTLGAVYEGEGRCRFSVWAPRAERVTVHTVTPEERWLPLERSSDGLHFGAFEGIERGTRYFFDLGDGLERPDPASRFQPDGVHGPSAVVDPAFGWTDDTFRAPALEQLAIYELHVGTFSREGTFAAVVPHLSSLADLGINAVELMPVAQFPGGRNWGYDGVYPFAVQDSYGGPEGLRRLVNACHGHGLAVALDVVHNHIGPEGNTLHDFGPYFTDHYRTPWGDAVNFDGPGSDRVRQFFIQSALAWIVDYHIDILRLDAIHAIMDASAEPFLRELGRAIHQSAERLGRRVYVIAESDLNDPRVIRPPEIGGHGLDAQWSDDFHHAVHAFLTGERQGYYEDFGSLGDIARAYRGGYVYSGQFSSFRNRRHGSPPDGCPGRRFVVCTQNHDQIGNRAQGDRLTAHLGFAQEKLLACVLLLAPYVPLLFMGQEYGEEAPFQYFTSHGDRELVEAVRRGRREEFAAFGWNETEIPDPQDEATFDRSTLTRRRLDTAQGRCLRDLHRALLSMRRSLPALRRLDRTSITASPDEELRRLVVHRWHEGDAIAACFAFGDATELLLPSAGPSWTKVLDTEEPAWGGGGTRAPEKASGADRIDVQAASCVVYTSTQAI